MNVEEINKQIKMLIGNLSFTMDYNQLIKGTKRLLIVEGQTDKKFIESILKDDVVCVVANKAFGVNKGISQERFNSKCAIMQVVYGMSKIPIVLNIPKGFEKCIVFGLIDLDFDSESAQYLNTPRLFVTDTHDLETLLLSTDTKLLQRIDNCSISESDIRKALYLAYQIGLLRKVIYDLNKMDLSLQAIASGAEISISEFLEEYDVSVRDFVHYINQNDSRRITQPNEKKLADAVIADKRIKKKLDKNGKWKSALESFETSTYPDFWDVVNGHDILSILRYLNEDAARKYSNSGAYRLNRDFEMDLIENYDYSYLGNTKVYSDMRVEKVVKEV